MMLLSFTNIKQNQANIKYTVRQQSYFYYSRIAY